MLPSESTIWSGSVTKLPGRAPASLGRKSPPASASKIVTLTASPMPRGILLGGRRENNRCVRSALSSCIRFCRSMVPPAALLHRTRVRNWREESESHCGGKDDSGLPDQHWILICRSPPLRGLDELRERAHTALLRSEAGPLLSIKPVLPLHHRMSARNLLYLSGCNGRSGHRQKAGPADA